ncbi:MAG: hypothetical protein Pars92KO_05260 [Parasphingorhabdus sp.]
MIQRNECFDLGQWNGFIADFPVLQASIYGMFCTGSLIIEEMFTRLKAVVRIV